MDVKLASQIAHLPMSETFGHLYDRHAGNCGEVYYHKGKTPRIGTNENESHMSLYFALNQIYKL